MLRLAVRDGRIAWFCGDDAGRAEEMAAELFPDLSVTIEKTDEP